MAAAIKGSKGLVGMGRAQADRLWVGSASAERGQTIAIKGMQGLTEFQHHQVGDVHHVVDGTQPRPLQAGLQPTGRRSNPKAREGREAEQAALFDGVLIRWSDGQGLRGDRGGGRAQGQRSRSEGCHFPGDALHGQPVGSVGGDGQLQHLIIEAQQGAHGAAQSGTLLKHLIEDHDAFRAVGQAQLGEGTDHAAAGHAPQLGWLDREVHRWQIGPHGGDSHVDAGAHVAGSADNLQWLRSTNGNAANAQLVGVGMRFSSLHKAHHHAGCPGGKVVDLLHFKAGHRQTFSQFGRGQIAGHQLPKPLERDPHCPIDRGRETLMTSPGPGRGRRGGIVSHCQLASHQRRNVLYG